MIKLTGDRMAVTHPTALSINDLNRKAVMPKRKSTKSEARVVYFIQIGEDGPIKIGMSRGNPIRRLQAMQTGMPYELRVMGVVAEEFGRTEGQLHERFDHLRLRGEWFRPEADLIAFIKANAKPFNDGNPPMPRPVEERISEEDWRRDWVAVGIAAGWERLHPDAKRDYDSLARAIAYGHLWTPVEEKEAIAVFGFLSKRKDW